METQSKTNAKDFFINLGAIVSLYATVVSLVSLLFTIINNAYPQVNSSYGYYASSSISWPVATIIVFFPIFIFLMWLLEKDYKVNPEKQNSGIHRWLTYITLFVAGATMAIDLIVVLYNFLDGQELTTGFILKILFLLIIAGGIFSYYLHDVLGKLTAKSRNIYRVSALIVILGSIIWGFAVIGSPYTQRQSKYDAQKLNDLSSLNNEIINFYSNKRMLPSAIAEIESTNYYIAATDPQTHEPYEYKKLGDLTYNLCAEFNTATNEKDKNSLAYETYMYGTAPWVHPAGHYCFAQTINPEMYTKPLPLR